MMGILLKCLGVISRVFPRVSVTLLLTWSFWAVLFKVLLVLPVFAGLWGLLFGATLTFVWAMCLTTYYCVLFVGPGSPTEFPMLMVPEYTEDENGNSTMVAGEASMHPPERFVSHSMMVKSNGGFRFCSKCKCWKPDRSHHCSSCEKCILKMDHHCPWFSECIGFRNYRYFMQFLAYSEVYLVLLTWLSGWVLVQFFVQDRWDVELFSFHVLFVFCLGLVFTLCMACFTGFTLYQLLRNKTTIESYEMQRYRRRRQKIGNVFDLGWRENWRVVMGQHWWQWLLPIRYRYDIGSQCEDADLYADGLCFPLEEDVASGLRLVERLERVSGELERGLLRR